MMATGFARYSRPVALGLVLVCLAVLPFGASNYVILVVTSILAYSLLAMSISFISGHGGMLTLAHAAYAGVASYTVAIVARHLTTDGLVQLAAAVVAGVVVAGLSGWIVVRASGTFLLMLSLAVGELLRVLAVQWRSVTHGSDGYLAGGPFTILGSKPIVPVGQVYWICLVVFVIVGALLQGVVRSPYGETLRGIRDNEVRMRSLGYRTSAYKYSAWVLSGAVAGCAGWLSMAQLPRLIAPDQMSFALGGLLLLAVVIGGIESMWGACLGAAVMVLMTNVVSQDLGGRGPLVLGIVLVIAVYALPKGLAGLLQRMSTMGAARRRQLG